MAVGLIKPTVAGSHAGVAVTWQQTAAEDSASAGPRQGVGVKIIRRKLDSHIILIMQTKRRNEQRRLHEAPGLLRHEAFGTLAGLYVGMWPQPQLSKSF